MDHYSPLKLGLTYHPARISLLYRSMADHRIYRHDMSLNPEDLEQSPPDILGRLQQRHSNFIEMGLSSDQLLSCIRQILRNQDLNRASDAQLKAAKHAMDQTFQSHHIKSTDTEFVYDRRVSLSYDEYAHSYLLGNV